MCLELNKRSKVKIATKPILVWKYVVQKNHSWTPAIHTCNYLPYEFNIEYDAYEGNEKLEKLKISVDSFRGYVKEVRSGFHSFSNLWAATQSDIDRYAISFPSLKFAVIPEGAQFIRGKHNEIVSTKIVVFETLVDMIRYYYERLHKKIKLINFKYIV